MGFFYLRHKVLFKCISSCLCFHGRDKQGVFRAILYVHFIKVYYFSFFLFTKVCQVASKTKQLGVRCLAQGHLSRGIEGGRERCTFESSKNLYILLFD